MIYLLFNPFLKSGEEFLVVSLGHQSRHPLQQLRFLRRAHVRHVHFFRPSSISADEDPLSSPVISWKSLQRRPLQRFFVIVLMFPREDAIGVSPKASDPINISRFCLHLSNKRKLLQNQGAKTSWDNGVFLFWREILTKMKWVGEKENKKKKKMQVVQKPGILEDNPEKMKFFFFGISEDEKNELERSTVVSWL